MMIVPVRISGYSEMINSINGNTQAQRVYFETPNQNMGQPKTKKVRPMFFSAADLPLYTLAAAMDRPQTLSQFAKSFTKLPLMILGLAIPGAIATKLTTKVIEHRAEKGKETSPFASMAGFIGAWYGLYEAGKAGLYALANAIPQSTKQTIREGFSSLEKTIDSSKANTEVYEPIAKKVSTFFTKNPQLLKPAIVASSIGALALCFAPSIKQSKQVKKEYQQQQKQQIMQAQQFARIMEENQAFNQAQFQNMQNFFNN